MPLGQFRESSRHRMSRHGPAHRYARAQWEWVTTPMCLTATVRVQS